MLPQPDYVVTIHGVGEHEPEQVANELAQAIGVTRSFQVIDFNWSTAVDGFQDDEPHALRLSRAIAVANSYLDNSPKIVRYLVEAMALLWAVTLLLTAMSPLFFVPSMVEYVYLASGKEDFKNVYEPFFELRPALFTVIKVLFIAGFLASLTVVVVAGLSGLVRKERLGWQLMRAGLLAFLRPVLVVVFALAWVRTVGYLATGVGVIAMCLVLTVLGKLAALILQIDYPSWRAILNLFLPFFAFFVVALVAAIPFYVLHQFFRWPLRFFRDVFHYAGDKEIRVLIHDKLKRKISEIPADSNVAILSHSLGTVIAVDSIINGTAWRHLGTITLVTGGSPIRRWFQRFFPNLFFPADPQIALDAARSKASMTAWMNIYRERDPVGASLGFAQGHGGVDRPTGQPELRGLKAHIEYWSSPEVHAVARELWASLEPLPPCPNADQDVRDRTTVDRPPRERVGFQTVLVALAVSFAFALVGSISSCVHLKREHVSFEEAFVTEALEEGRRVTAQVFHQEVVDPDFPNMPSAQRFVFTYDTGGEKRTLEFNEYDTEVGCCRSFDSAKMREHFRSGEDQNVARIFEVEIAYLDRVEDLIVVPDFPAKPLPWHTSMKESILLSSLFATGLLLGLTAVGMICGIGALLLLGVLPPAWDKQ